MRRSILMSIVLTAVVVLWFAGVATAQEAGAGAKDSGGAGGVTTYLDWFFIKGGPIAWLLIAVDIASWAVIIEHLVTIRRLNILPEPVKAQIGDMVEARQYKEMIEYASTDPSFLAYVVHQSLSEASHGYAAMERAMEEAAEERTAKLLRKIELLNVIGNVSPMMGLLGTVYGMIDVFSTIVDAGGMPDPAGLAGGVGIALVTTFWGLIVAIPALAVYAFMRNRIDSLSSEVMMVAQETISTFRPGGKKKSNGG